MTYIKSFSWMILFSAFIPLGDSLSRILTESGVHTTQILFLEYGGIALVLLPFIKTRKLSLILNDPLKSWHVTRCLSFFLACNIWIGVIKYVPLTQLYAVGFLAPVIAVILSSALLNESLTRYKVVSLIVGLVGIVVIIRPGISEVSPFLIIALGSPVFWAFFTVSTKRLSSNYSQITLLFILSFSALLFSAPFALYNWVEIPIQFWKLIGTIIFIAFTAQIALITAYKNAPLTILAPFEFLTLIFATLYAIVFFNESINFFTVVGATMIITSNIYIAVKSTKEVLYKQQT
jgi:drug/metabolite transporter (DMT)-like permease